MGATNLLLQALGLVLAVQLASAVQWDYEWGVREDGDFIIYEYEGNVNDDIPPIVIGFGLEINDVKVTVVSVPPPQINYDPRERQVSIVFAYAFVKGTVKITAYAVPVIPVSGETSESEE